MNAVRKNAVPDAGLYVGRVMHARLRPVRHAFRYRVFSLLLDIDRPEAIRRLWMGRLGLISFAPRDHGPRGGGSLRQWAERRMREAGHCPDGGAIRLLCFPRILGFVFNPLSIYYCYRQDGPLAAVLYQVHNTFGESHTYVCPAGAEGGAILQAAEKAFYVSPFMPMETSYAFRLNSPGETLSVSISEQNESGPLLVATHAARRRPLTDGELLRAWLAHPLMTLKVVAGIHWEALRLWRKGMRFVAKPARTEPGVSAGRSVSAVLTSQ